MPDKVVRFGQVGVEKTIVGDRYVMWIGLGQVVMLRPLEDDEGPDAQQGMVTYVLKDTKWLKTDVKPSEIT